MTHDLIIRGGIVHDGLGSAPVQADIAIDGDTIVAVGTVTGEATRTIDASGSIVTPGFVDLHTHMDAQAAWDPSISTCSNHGITSALIGASRPEQVVDCAGAVGGLEFTAEELAEIDGAAGEANINLWARSSETEDA